MEKIYLAYDLAGDDNDLIGVFRTEKAAQQAISNFLINDCGYTESDWQDMAENRGFKNKDEFIDAISTTSNYNDSMRVAILTEELKG